MRRRLPLLVLMTCSTLAAGCSGGGDKPVTLPSLTPTVVASASPVAVPQAAQARTPQGADAFARFYFEQLNIAFSTSDASIIRTFSGTGCGTCELYAKGLEEGRLQGLRLVGTAFQVKDVAAAPIENGRGFVDVFGNIPAKRQVDSSGKTIRDVPSQGRFHFTLTLVKSTASWSVDEIRIDKA